MYSGVESTITDAFRDSEKYYAGKYRPFKNKRNNKKDYVDYSGVIDFRDLENNTPENRALIQPVTINHSPSKYFNPIQKAYTISNVEGLIFIPNPFTDHQQKEWVARCIKKYTVGNPTNYSNLLGPEHIWDEWKSDMMKNLRWASVGYHFQWTQRIYTDEHRGPFPEDLEEYVTDMAHQLGYSMKPEASIINFYPNNKCCMGGHLDDAEDDMTKPIISTSFGNTVVFLIGGTERNIKPVPLYIRSGDIVVMGGHARYCYHGVPKMIPDSSPSFFTEDYPEEPDWDIIREYIKYSRINMNVRQVRGSVNKI